MKTRILTLAVAICFLLVANGAFAQNLEELKKGFENPPDSARPLVWWHWMNGNISKEGIKLDLEWMHRVGIAGFQNFDAALATPQVVEKRLAYMTPEWKEAFKYAIELGDSMGMEMAIAGSPGWSESGGPWVPPAQGMKKYVWSETIVEGGKPFAGKIAQAPTVTGPFQNIPKGPGKTQEFYADSAVVAFPMPADASDDAGRPVVTTSGGKIDGAMLSDGDLVQSARLPMAEPGEAAWIQFEYSAPQTIRAITYVIEDPAEIKGTPGGGAAKSLEVSDDGKDFHEVVSLPSGRTPEHTISFTPVKGKYFRVTLTRRQRAGDADGPQILAKVFKAAELVLHGDARVNRFEEKAAFVPVGDVYPLATGEVDQSSVIKKSDVIDLTKKMQPDGTLDWTPPAGKWVVLRIGYSLLGTTNHPATAEATGLEVDKLDRRYVKDYMEKYLDTYKETVGDDLIGKRGLRYVINDSWEARSQNWTDNMIAQFKTLRGYDPTPWLPVLAGRVVESSKESDRFLWDFRKTIADLIATEHYGQLQETLHERGMGHYVESHESGRAFVADGMEVKKFSDVPMSAMWTQNLGVNKVQFGANADIRESASVAHIYGKNRVAAESMTARPVASWAWSPATLKPTADAEMLNGVNRFVIHESAHQPLVDKPPGLTLGPYGQWFNRNETWAEQARPWIDYLSRSSYLLQRGRFVADAVYFYGEDSNLTEIFRGKGPDVPAGYGFDYVNADALIHELSVENGEIVTKSGMRYRVLALDPYSRQMSLPVLKAIHQLAMDGAVVVGPKPTDDPSQADNQAEFNRLATELFGDGSGEHHVGKGTVYAGQNLKDVFAVLEVKPDFEYPKERDDQNLEFVHRKLDDVDIYFVDNRSDQETSVAATFRVNGKAPELWHAETGAVELANYEIGVARTIVPLKLEPWGTVFVVFAKPTTETSRIVPESKESKLATMSGSWKVEFQPERGAPESITMNELIDWSKNDDPGVKYFSGIATYTGTIDAAPDWFRDGAKLCLDLGDVKNLAVVSVNGQEVGQAWHAPYRVDVTGTLKPGANEIKVKVANAWVNRLIGDEQPGAKKITFADVKPYKADSPLLPSGLLGPVTVVRSEDSEVGR